MVALRKADTTEDADPVYRLLHDGRLTLRQADAAEQYRGVVRLLRAGREEAKGWAAIFSMRVGLRGEGPETIRVLDAVVVQGRSFRSTALKDIWPGKSQRLLTQALDLIAAFPPPS